MSFLDALRSVFRAITDVVAYFSGRSAAKQAAEKWEEVSREAQAKVGGMSDVAVRDELLKYARGEEGNGRTDADGRDPQKNGPV